MIENLTFGEALVALKKGYKIKRKGWGGYWELMDINDFGVCIENFIIAKLKDNGGHAPAQPYQADILAEDWEII